MVPIGQRLQNPSAASRANQNAAADGSPGLVPAADERTLERLPERLMVPINAKKDAAVYPPRLQSITEQIVIPIKQIFY